MESALSPLYKPGPITIKKVELHFCIPSGEEQQVDFHHSAPGTTLSVHATIYPTKRTSLLLSVYRGEGMELSKEVGVRSAHDAPQLSFNWAYDFTTFYLILSSLVTDHATDKNGLLLRVEDMITYEEDGRIYYGRLNCTDSKHMPAGAEYVHPDDEKRIVGLYPRGSSDIFF